MSVTKSLQGFRVARKTWTWTSKFTNSQNHKLIMIKNKKYYNDDQ